MIPGRTPRSRRAPLGWPLAWGTSCLALAVLTGVMLVFREQLDRSHIALLYLLLVLGGSAMGGRALGLVLAGASFVAFDFLFLKPYYTLTIANPLDWLVLGSFFVTSIVATELLERQRRQAALADRRADELDQLATLGAETLDAGRADQALAAIAGVIRAALGVERCELFVRDEELGELDVVADTAAARNPVASQPGSASGLLAYIIASGRAAVERQDGTLHVINDALLMENATPIEEIRAFAVPLAVRGRTVGALRASAPLPFTLTAEHWRELGVLSLYAALGIERRRLESAAEDAEALRRADRVKDALLTSVSHDLRTPLTTIKGIAHEVRSGADPGRAALIEEEVDRLTMLVDDLLDLSQLKAGALPVRLEVNTVDDLIGAALQRSEHALRAHHVAVAPEDWELLLGRFDLSHTLRILSNLLENAAKYSPADSPIEVCAERHGDRLRIAVSDHGPGIPLADRERIFEPFFRSAAAPAGVRGAGLGLSIARQLAEVQGGRLDYTPRPEGGSTFTVDLEAAELPVPS